MHRRDRWRAPDSHLAHFRPQRWPASHCSAGFITSTARTRAAAATCSRALVAASTWPALADDAAQNQKTKAAPTPMSAELMATGSHQLADLKMPHATTAKPTIASTESRPRGSSSDTLALPWLSHMGVIQSQLAPARTTPIARMLRKVKVRLLALLHVSESLDSEPD